MNMGTLAREIQNAKRVILPNCGHVPREECPQEFMQAVKEFIEAGVMRR